MTGLLRVGLALLPLLGCAGEPLRSPPPASFLVVAGDSTYWAEVKRGTSSLRSSPLLLAELDGRFHEVYLADDDRSYYDAVIVGQRVYRRDLISGDSVMMFEDSALAQIAAAYAQAHPQERRLAEDEEASDDPASVATTETEIVDVLGPFATIHRHVDFDLESGDHVHTTRRDLLDLRTGRAASLGDLMADSVVRRVVRDGRTRFAGVRDSIRRAAAEGGEVDAEMLPYFAFDSSSFSLVTEDGRPAIAFLAPGSGPDAGETALPLPPIGIPAGDWWRSVSPTLPSAASADADEWEGKEGIYRVVVLYDALSAMATLAVRDSAGEDWPVGTLPLPVHRVHRLDREDLDGRTPRALARAFDEAARYSAERKTATISAPPRAMRLVARLFRQGFRD